jgi:hypothetical protein
MSSLTFEVTTKRDDPDLRRFLCTNPMRSLISLSFEREANYFNAAAIEDLFRQTTVTREADSGNVIAFGKHSVRRLFVNRQM